MDLKPPPSSFAYLDKRRCGEALSMLLESIQYLLNNTTFNEHGIEKETPDNLKAVLREHMLIKLRSFEAVYSKYEQDKVTVLYLQRTFVDFHEKYVLPFVEKNFGSYKDKIHAVSGGELNKKENIEIATLLSSLVKLPNCILDSFFRASVGAPESRVTLVNQLNSYLSVFTQFIDRIQILNEEIKGIKLNILAYILDDLDQMVQSVKTLYHAVRNRDDKEDLFAQLKAHFEKSLIKTKAFGNGTNKSFDENIDIMYTTIKNGYENGVGAVNYRYAHLATFLMCGLLPLNNDSD